MSFEIFDFHIHPFYTEDEKISAHKEYMEECSVQDMLRSLEKAGIYRFAGSVISHKGTDLEAMQNSNRSALAVRKECGNRYYPGIQVDPRYVDESISAIEETVSLGFNLIGELVPYSYKWEYSDTAFRDILDHTDGRGMVYSLHTNTTDVPVLEELAKCYKDTTFVFAHPGEKDRLIQHIAAMRRHENIFLDLSGTGLFRLGMLKRLVSEVGADRILFGSDYPICNPGMYVGGVMFESISDEERDLIFHKNAERILGIQG